MFKIDVPGVPEALEALVVAQGVFSWARAIQGRYHEFGPIPRIQNKWWPYRSWTEQKDDKEDHTHRLDIPYTHV